jgi:hypothetical protein
MRMIQRMLMALLYPVSPTRTPRISLHDGNRNLVDRHPGMRVMALEDVLVTRLLALDEQALDYKSLLQMARPIREQVDWDDVRARTGDSPYAAAFFTFVERLGVVESPSRG